MKVSETITPWIPYQVNKKWNHERIRVCVLNTNFILYHLEVRSLPYLSREQVIRKTTVYILREHYIL